MLDTGKGAGAKGVEVTLFRQDAKGDGWQKVDAQTTDENGRIKTFLPREKQQDNTGVYKLVFHTEPYFAAHNQKTFYPQIDVMFKISDETHYHVPITLSSHGYATYRGN